MITPIRSAGRADCGGGPLPERLYFDVAACREPDSLATGEFAAERFGDLAIGRSREFTATGQFIGAGTVVVRSSSLVDAARQRPRGRPVPTALPHIDPATLQAFYTQKLVWKPCVGSVLHDVDRSDRLRASVGGSHSASCLA